eukprot:gene4107-5857_t
MKNYSCKILLLLIYFAYSKQFNENSFNQTFPTAYTQYNRVFGSIVGGNFRRIDPFIIILNEYKAMCEGGWNVTIAVFSFVELSESLHRFIEQKLFCYRILSQIQFKVIVYPSSIGYLLSEQPRKYAKLHLDDYDVFMYQEEDMIIQYAHLVGFLYETKRIYQLLNEKGISDYCIGFQRYRRHMRSHEHNKRHISEQEILHQEYLEELPYFEPICIQNEPYFKVTSFHEPTANPHQGVWIFTQYQIKLLQSKCNFLDQTIRDDKLKDYTREYMASLSYFDNLIINKNCGLQKIIPGERLSSFVVHHFYHTTDPTFQFITHPLFYTDEHLKAGFLQIESPVMISPRYNTLACWGKVTSKFKTDNNLTLLANNSVLIKAKNSKNIYLFRNGTKHLFSSGEVFSNHGYNWKDVFTIPHGFIFDIIPSGPDIT